MASACDALAGTLCDGYYQPNVSKVALFEIPAPRMKPTLLAALIATSISVMAVTETNAATTIGQPSPSFVLNDACGKLGYSSSSSNPPPFSSYNQQIFLASGPDNRSPINPQR